MFIIILTYLKPMSEVLNNLEAHIEYLDKYYASGHFIASGRQEPRTGGVILSRAKDKEEIQKLILEDPFHINGVAKYDIIEFEATKYAPGFEKYL